MKTRPKVITMAGSVVDPQTPMEDSEDNSSTFESNREETTRQGTARNVLKNQKSEDGNAKKSTNEGQQMTSADSQKPATAADDEDTKPARSPEEGIAREVITSDPPGTSDIEKDNISKTSHDLKVDTSLPLVHLGHPSSTKSRKSTEPRTPKALDEEASEESSEDSSVMSTRTKVMIYLCFCLAIVFILQGIIIGMLVDDKDDGKNNNTAKAPQTPTPSVATPSSPPTLDVQQSDYAFQSIASAPGAFLIDELSNCDDCLAAIYPDADDQLKWNSFATINEVVIDSNGFFLLNCELYGVCGEIDLTSSLDLAPHVEGNIYALWGREPRRKTNLGNNNIRADYDTVPPGRQQKPPDLITTLILSWEDVNLFGYDNTRRIRVNAQVKLSEQEIVFCFGAGNVNGEMFRSGILNYTNGQEYTPVNITGFDRDGYSTTFPVNECDSKILH